MHASIQAIAIGKVICMKHPSTSVSATVGLLDHTMHAAYDSGDARGLNRIQTYLQPGLIILCPALIIVHVPFQGLLGVLPLHLLLIIVALLLCNLVSA